MAAPAQWLNYKSPGVPRTPDRKPNLSAPTPRMADGKPDFTGLWVNDPAGSAAMNNAINSIKPQPWAAAVSDQRKEDLLRDDPRVACLPAGPLVNFWPGKVVHTPDLLLMLGSGTLYREVFLDGRELPKEPNSDWLGYSIGRWEGETLVIDSNGFNDRTWIDYVGHPHTEALRLTERWRRSDYGHLDVIATYVDPGSLREPWTVPLKYELDPDTQPLEYVCNENERDRVHMIGKASDEKGIDLAPEVLERYAGTYEFRNPTVRLTFDVTDGRLVMNIGGGSGTPLTPISETKFFVPGGSILEFVLTGNGPATKLIDHVAGQEREGFRN
jgi:hypothetical protein